MTTVSLHVLTLCQNSNKRTSILAYAMAHRMHIFANVQYISKTTSKSPQGMSSWHAAGCSELAHQPALHADTGPPGYSAQADANNGAGFE
jgi:hypothetical protein